MMAHRLAARVDRLERAEAAACHQWIEGLADIELDALVGDAGGEMRHLTDAELDAIIAIDAGTGWWRGWREWRHRIARQHEAAR